MNAEESFVANMIAFRKGLKITQNAFAAKAREHGLPFHQPTVQRIEDGSRPVRLNEAEVIAEILGLTVPAMCSVRSLDFIFANVDRPSVSALVAERDRARATAAALEQELDEVRRQAARLGYEIWKSAPRGTAQRSLAQQIVGLGAADLDA